MIDLHIHTELSPDAKGTFEQYISFAIEHGLKIVGFTEHWDFDRFDPTCNFDVHKKSQEICRGYCGPIEVLYGAEIGYHRIYEDYVTKCLDEVKLDFILGSVHEVEGLMISEVAETGEFFSKFGKKGFQIYFEAVANFAQDGIFDVLGHLDVIKRFSVLYDFPFKEEQHKAQIIEILDILVARNKALEINTSGLRQPPGASYPSLKVARWFFERGGKYITVGSDSHEPAMTGRGCDETIQNLINMGIIDITIFKERYPIVLNVIGEPSQGFVRKLR
ncbi:MAG TPA: histidinol-phosphatase HisJ family protein [Caldisericia bacterium]|nr:histidinol-phosphatase HisJ family protein [Caldisericia bacterium]HNY61696.1 histidinol-phosphatase HisJ family protein [Caldisericia bacterium]HOC80044.1 histidinol-phosphatase HisJ family protein [Caldisericia bacterium]HOG70696.1 histidinol-phosphatase HisJ family protein [Caldisericia bacterium]HPA65084.1 histidinol-phosphatase HisJ family protein [Caldisericia bacterium]